MYKTGQHTYIFRLAYFLINKIFDVQFNSKYVRLHKKERQN